MAVEVEAAGQIDEFLRVLARRVWWIVVPLSVIGSLGCLFAVVVPKKYVCKTEVMVHNLGEVTGQFGQNASAIEGQVARFNVMSHARITSVLNKLRWPDYQPLDDTERRGFVEDLLPDLSVRLETMPRASGQQLVGIVYKDTDPDRAMEFLEALLHSWTTEVLNRHLEREQKELSETKEKLADNQKRIQVINEDRAEIRTEYQITPQSMVEGFRRDAPEHRAFAEHKRITRELADLELEIEQREYELEVKELAAAKMPQYAEPDSAADLGPLQAQLEAIDARILAQQARIQEGGWAPGHSQRKSADRLIQDLKVQRDDIIANAARTGFGNPDELPKNPDWLLLQEQIESEKDQITAKKRIYASRLEQEAELRSETERLQQAIKEIESLDAEAATLQESIKVLQQQRDELEITVRTLDSPQGNPFEIHLPPLAPTRPTSPNPWVIAIGAIVAGLVLGLGLAVLKEYSKNCFRSARELSRVMTHPVLGTVNMIRTRRERARALLLRSMLGGGSLLFALSVGYVTWAWKFNQDALTDSLVEAINGFRRMLM